jgi:VanZ family protein
VKYYIPAGIWGLIVTWLSLLPANSFPELSWKGLLEVDKLAHASVYGILSGLMAWAGWKNLGLRWYAVWIFSIIASVYGLLMELFQLWFSTGRFFEKFDLIANIIGAFVGAVIVKIVLNKIYKL